MTARKFPDRETLAFLCASGMSVEHIAETYGATRKSALRRLREYDLEAISPKDALARVDAEQILTSRNERGIFLRADRITHMCDAENQQVRPMSLPRISMYVAALVERHPELKGQVNA